MQPYPDTDWTPVMFLTIRATVDQRAACSQESGDMKRVTMQGLKFNILRYIAIL